MTAMPSWEYSVGCCEHWCQALSPLTIGKKVFYVEFDKLYQKYYISFDSNKFSIYEVKNSDFKNKKQDYVHCLRTPYVVIYMQECNY